MYIIHVAHLITFHLYTVNISWFLSIEKTETEGKCLFISKKVYLLDVFVLIGNNTEKIEHQTNKKIINKTRETCVKFTIWF